MAWAIAAEAEAEAEATLATLAASSPAPSALTARPRSAVQSRLEQRWGFVGWRLVPTWAQSALARLCRLLPRKLADVVTNTDTPWCSAKGRVVKDFIHDQWMHVLEHPSREAVVYAL